MSVGTPIAIEIDRSKRYRVGESGVIALRVTGLAAAARSIHVRVAGPGLDSQRDLACERTSDPLLAALLPWVPPHAGESLLAVSGTVGDGRRRVGQFDAAFSVVVERAQAGPSVSYVIQGQTIDFKGVDLSTVVREQRHEEIPAGAPRWESLGLDWTPARPIHVLDGPSASRRAVLRAVETGVEWVVVTGARIACGRHSQNDVVLRFLPENSENDQRSAVIRREQFALVVDAGQVLAEVSGTSPTFIDGNRLTQGSRALIVTGTRVMAGLMGLELRADIRHDDDAAAVETLALIHAEHDRQPVAHAPSAPTMVRLRRVGNHPGVEYCWLHRSVTLGTTSECGWRLSPPAAPRQARLFFVNGRFFMEALASKPALVISGHALEAGDVRQLGAAEQIRCAEQAFDWRIDR